MNPADRLSDAIPSIRRLLLLPPLALASVISKDGQSVYASSDTLFKGAIFGRDSLEVADDLMQLKPALVHNILLTMGRLQGTVDNPENEEQPGKIIHEYRATRLNGRLIDSTSMDIFHKLASKWGGTDTEMAYYGSVDATPHFLRTLGRYCVEYGNDILQETVTRRDGETVSMRHVAESATTWLLGQLAASRSGMIEYQKVNPHGISNQVWKDSEEFYVHENGEMANHDRPIASIEVQGLAYDALTSASHILPAQTNEVLAEAHKLRDITIAHLWQPDRKYFALGTDYDAAGQLRVIQTATANPGALLDTGFFDELEPAKRQEYVMAIVKRLMSEDFLTNAGIRSRSLDAAKLIPFWDYHGSYVTWPKETYDIAKGLRRHGFHRLGRQLENRLVNLVLKTREYPEFVYVDKWGRVLTGKPRPHSHGDLVLVEGPNTPERLQAWTVSALMAIISSRGQARLKRRGRPQSGEWQSMLETHIVTTIPHIEVMLNPFKLWLNYRTAKYHLSGPPPP